MTAKIGHLRERRDGWWVTREVDEDPRDDAQIWASVAAAVRAGGFHEAAEIELTKWNQPLCPEAIYGADGNDIHERWMDSDDDAPEPKLPYQELMGELKLLHLRGYQPGRYPLPQVPPAATTHEGEPMTMFDIDMNPIGPATHAQTLAADVAAGGWIWIDEGGVPHGVTDEIRDPDDDTAWLPVTSTGVRRDLRKVCVA